MRDVQSSKTNTLLQYGHVDLKAQENSPFNGEVNISIVEHQTKTKKRKKYKVIKKYAQQTHLMARLSCSNTWRNHRSLVTKHSSMPKLQNKENYTQTRPTSPNNTLESKYGVNLVSEEQQNPFYNPHIQTRLKVYRCQLNTNDGSCCCTCNSDVMFDVMKSLYDCYKNKNCDHCNCILCGHLPCEKKRIAVIRKSATRVGEKEILERAEKAMEGMTIAEKENMMKNLIVIESHVPEPKTPLSQKEQVQKLRSKCGTSLPAGKTPSEKVKVPSEKWRKAKSEGLLMPIGGKTPEQQEKIFKCLAMQSLPLAKGKTDCKTKLIDKVRADMGLPPGPKTAFMMEKFNKVADAPLSQGGIPSKKLKHSTAAGLLIPLRGKTPEQKQSILRNLAMQGIPLPTPKTVSEKKLVEKVHAELDLPLAPKSAKYRKATEAVAITPVERKSLLQKERILCGQHDMGLPISEGRTPSVKAIIEQIKAGERRKRKTSGLPPGLPPQQRIKESTGPVNGCVYGIFLSKRGAVDKAPGRITLEKLTQKKAAGLLTPLEGKTPSQKENILKVQAAIGLPLPEGLTASEKPHIAEVKGTAAPSITSKKIRKSKTAGLLTPLGKKPPEEKERILKGLVKVDTALPEGKTPSEKAIIDKIITAAGIPEETASGKILNTKAAGLMTPLDGEIMSRKEIMTVRTAAGLPLLEGKMRQEKATGLLTSLEAESPEQKEKNLNGLVKTNVPLPQPKTSEKYPINKIRRNGLPPQPKTPSPLRQPSRITASPALPPEGSPNLYEKSAKVKKERKGPAGECFCGLLTPESERLTEKKASKVRIPSEKIRKAKAAGLLTPLKEKSAAEKEKILKGLAMQGLPLPAAKTASERNLVVKVRKDLGLPPEPKTASEKKRYEKAIALCVIVPLENMPPSIKEKTLRAQVELGLQLPEGRTASEKALISKVINESKTVSKVSIEKCGKAKAVGLLTPSEKLMMHRVRTEPKIPPPVKTISEKELIRDRKTEGFLTPLAKKSSEQNDKILKGLDATGLLMPEGKTASEKQLINKIRTAADLPTEATPSEKKGILKSKLEIISLRSTREIAAKNSKVEGMSEEYEDISKTTTCDRCCGCDRKKIRFQHSYVKIKPTSPSISSHCFPCPDESIPCVKGGIRPDNKGIKVTIKSADRVPRYYTEFAPYSPTIEEKVFTMECDYKPIDSSPFVSNSKSTEHTKIRNKKIPKKLCKNGVEYIFQYDTRHRSCDESLGKVTSKGENRNSVIYIYNSMLQSDYNYWMNESNALLETISNEALVHKRPELVSGSSNDCTQAFSQCSINSSLIKKSETLTTASLCDSIQIISVLSFADSVLTSNSSHYLCYAASENSNSSYTAVHESDYFADTDNMTRKGYLNKSNSNTDIKLTNVNKHHTRNQILTMSESKFKINDALEKFEPVILINDMNSDQDIMTMMDELLASREFSGASSIYVVLPSSSDSESETNDPSALCLRVSERKLKLSNSLERRQRMSSIACASKISKTPKSNNYESYASPKYCKADVICPLETSHTINENIKKLQETTQMKQSDVNRPHKTTQTEHTDAITPQETLQINLENRLQPLHKNTTNQKEQNLQEKKIIHKLYQTILPKNKKIFKQNIVTTDTSQDRPCFCPPSERGLIHVLPNYGNTNQCVAGVVSELITPMTMKQDISQDIPIRDLSFSTQTSLSKHNYHIPDTPVIMCRIPACVVTEDRSNDGHTRQLATSTPCPPGQWKFLPTLNSGQQISVGCGDSNSKLGVSLPVVTPKRNSTECLRCNNLEYDIENIYLTPCGSLEIKIETTCGTHCSNLEPKIEKASTGNKKKAKLKTLCECEPHDPPLCYCAPGAKKVKRSIGYQCCRCADAQSGTEQPITSDAKLCPNEKNNIINEKCVCNKKSAKKNKVICECPESEIDYITYADSETDMKTKWKMQSELTQTTSGFKLDVKKKLDVDCAMSFKDALAYHASLDIDAVDVNNNECCPCEVVARKIKKKATCECECLEEALECEPISKEPFNGIKLTITRKGPASKDLNDVCCFNMQTHESNTYMVAYYDEY